MENKRFQIIINGQLAEGVDLAQAQQNISSLFKASLEAVAPMFSGKRISVKKNIDQATAKKYQQLIIKAGLKAGVAPMPEQAPTDNVTTGEKSLKNGLTSEAIAAVGSIMDSRPPPPEANIDTSAYNMDEVGIILDETPTAKAPEIDISGYGMDEVGTVLDETPPIDSPEIDVSTISVKERGADLMEYTPPPEAEYDLSKFSMAAAGETLVQHAPAPQAEIDTSKLNMNEPN